MKHKTMTWLFGTIILICAVQTGLAFYNPETGRWLSRDPIEEGGGRSVYAFVSNDPVITVDWLGLIGMGDTKMHCCHLVWNDRTHCCDKGYIVSRKEKRPTGVVTHKWKQNPKGAGKVHEWLTWDGGSADSNGDSVIFEPGSKRVSFPAQSMPSPSDDEPLKLSPCEYDFEKLNACLSRKGATENGKYGGMCWDLPPKWIGDCMKESKK